ncbi:YicC family protein [bacterium]|nr:YicC family protein [bacterium]
MLYSMTGFGQGSATDGEITVLVEVKSINSRFLETQIRIPQILSNAEFKLKKLIKKFIDRGKIYLNAQIICGSNVSLWEISIDDNLLDTYTTIIEQIENRFVPERTSVSLDRFLTMNEIFTKIPNPKYQERIMSIAISAVNDGLKSLRRSRREEGKILQIDIQKRIVNVKNLLRKIEKMHNNATPSRFKNLREQVMKLISNVEIDPIRLAQEIAFIAAKSDCTEEIIRLESHISQIEKSIKNRKPVGSFLNFILQECHREINTIGSKTDINEISELVIHLKEEFERIREQVQNIE